MRLGQRLAVLLQQGAAVLTLLHEALANPAPSQALVVAVHEDVGVEELRDACGGETLGERGRREVGV